MAANSDKEASACYVKIYFGGGKEEALKIRQACQGRKIQGSSGVGERCRDRWVSGF